jgi:hypothetical protein
MVLIVSQSQAQEPCQVLETYPDGSSLVKIGNKTMLAITVEMARESLKLKSDLLAAQKQIVLKDSLLSKYDVVKAWYDTTLSQQKQYIAELEKVLDGYKGLLRDYKKLKEPWLTFDAALGATGDDKNPAVMMGLGIRRIRAWGFMQERNSGILVGTTFRLF